MGYRCLITHSEDNMSVSKGQKVTVHYVGTLDDGTEFDNSRTRGEPLKFELGAATIMPAFQDAVLKMKVGETQKFKIEAADAYGPVHQEGFRVVPKENFNSPEELVIGAIVQGQTEEGKRFAARVEEIEEDGIKLNFNHPMAGKNLNFEIELIQAV